MTIIVKLQFPEFIFDKFDTETAVDKPTKYIKYLRNVTLSLNTIFNTLRLLQPAMKAIILTLTIVFLGSVLPSPVVKNVEEGVVPAFDGVRDVVFLVYTRINPSIGEIVDIDDMSTVRNSTFSATRRTKFLIHGMFGDRHNPTNTLLYPAFLQAGDFSKFYRRW